jgi:Carboxypeptidase regulatory-like domain/TonB dependent receptor-like, beta-barrel
MRIKVAILGVAIMVWLAAALQAQSPNATVTGRITDPSEAIVPNATVTIVNTATGITYRGETNSAGVYSVTDLLPGTYRMQAEARGFKTVIKPGIILHVQEVAEINFQLAVGSLTELVTVQGGAPLVQLATSSISAVVGPNTVVDLPLNGRDWTQLATLQPSVNAVLTQQSLGGANSQRGTRGYGAQLTISGTRPQLNNYRLDGISISDYTGGSPGSVLGGTLGVDAVAEFSVLTSNYSAEYGRTSGGVINAITRSGTNQVHGDAFWFLRDEDFDARNFFDVNRAPFHRNQFGGSAGGPIQKGKTFIFADYEGLRQARGVRNIDKVPSPNARIGILNFASAAGFPAGCVATLVPKQCQLMVNKLVQPYLAVWSLPNAGLIGLGNTGVFSVAVNDISRENFETVRMDRKISDKDSIFGTWFYDSGLDQLPDSLDNWVIGNTSVRQMIGLEESHVFSPSLVNSLRAGYSRVSVIASTPIAVINPISANLTLGSFPGRPAPGISVTGLTASVGGLGGPSHSIQFWNSYQVYDDAFLTKGVHSLKFGFAFERMQHNLKISGRANGAFTFGSLAAFLTDQPLTFQGDVPTASSPLGVRQTLVGGYLQDDWRLRPSLTLNLGLRYELVTVPTEEYNRLSNLPTLVSPYPGHIGSPYFNNPTLRNFEPRTGFSWDPFHNGKTAVRGAFGIFDAQPLNYIFARSEGHGAPFNEAVSGTSLLPGSFPTVAATGNIVTSRLQMASIENNPHRNYVMIWNLNVQRQLTSSSEVTVGYVGNHGVHMVNRMDDANVVIPTLTPQGYLWPSPTGSGTRLNPTVGDIDNIYWGGDSLYDALEVQVSKRMSHGFQAQGSYTWGKIIDTGSASTLGDPFTNSIASLLWFCKSCRRGLADFNIAQTFVVDYLWHVPTPKNWGAISSHVLGGWEVGGIFTAETGVPITPLIGGDPLGLNSTDPWAYPNRLTGPGCTSDVNPGNPNNYIKLNCFAPPNPLTLFGNGGRNTVVGPGLANFDFSLFKNNYIKRISEKFNVQFRAEFFNILNRANFATPVDNSTFFDQKGNPVGGAGAIDKTSTLSREIQFALKLVW